MCAFTALAVAGGAAGFGAGATAATTGLLAGSTLGSAVMSDVGLLGSGMSMFSSVQQGDAQADMFKYQAEVTEQQNQLAEQDRLRRMDALTSSQIAQFGAMGTEFAGGSALDAVSQTAYNTQLDIFNDNYSATTQAQASRASGRNARTAGRTQAASTLLDFGFKAGQLYA